MVRIAVAEDDASWARQLRQYVKQYAAQTGHMLDLTVYTDGESLVDEYHGQFDVILLDVQMRDLDGMATAEIIRRTDPEVVILFITNMAQYAIRGYEVNALDYMLKPVSYDTFAQRLGRALSRIRPREKRFIALTVRGGVMKLATEDITFVESQGHRLIYHTTKNADFTTPGTIKEAEEMLRGASFFRCNKGYLLNLEHVAGVQDGCALVAGERLLISRGRKAPFLEALATYLGGG